MQLLPEIVRNEKTFLAFFVDVYQVKDLTLRVPQSEATINQFKQDHPGIKNALQPKLAFTSSLEQQIQQMNERIKQDTAALSRFNVWEQLLVQKHLTLLTEVRDFAQKVLQDGKSNTIYNATLVDKTIRYLINRDLHWRNSDSFAVQDPKTSGAFLIALSNGRSECSPAEAYLYFGIKMHGYHSPIKLLKSGFHRVDELLPVFKSQHVSICIDDMATLKEFYTISPVYFLRLVPTLSPTSLLFSVLIERKDDKDYQPMFKAIAAALRPILFPLAAASHYRSCGPAFFTAILCDANWPEQMNAVTALAEIKDNQLANYPGLYSPWLRYLIHQAKLIMENLVREVETLEETQAKELVKKVETVEEAKTQTDKLQTILDNIEEKLNAYAVCLDEFRTIKTVFLTLKLEVNLAEINSIEMPAKMALFMMTYRLHLPLQPSAESFRAAFYEAFPLLLEREGCAIDFDYLNNETLREFDRALLASVNLKDAPQDLTIENRLYCITFLWVNIKKQQLPQLDSLQAIRDWVDADVKQDSGIKLFAKTKKMVTTNLLTMRAALAPKFSS